MIPERTPDADPLAGFTLDSLLSGAARLRPERAAIVGPGGAARLTFAALDDAATRIAVRLQALGLAPADRLLIAGAADAATILLLLGALRAGLDVATAPLGLGAPALAAAAGDCGAHAIAGPAEVCGASASPPLFEAAAKAARVRFVGLVGGEADGALRLDDPDEPAAAGALPAPALRAGAILTAATGGDRPVLVHHRQQTLIAAALDFLARAEIGALAPIVATLAPVRFAGIVCGPLASLLSGAPLIVPEAPTTTAIAAALAGAEPAHLILPAALAAEVGRMAGGSGLASLTLVHAAGAAPDVRRIRTAPRINDLHRIGEYAAIAEPRGADGLPAPFPGEAHRLAFQEMDILVFEGREDAGGIAARGAGVTGGKTWISA